MISKSIKETFLMGKNLAKDLKGGDIVCLSGDLGAGKTVFVKGVANGLEIKGEINSPTFSIMNIYNAKGFDLIHYDMYRIENELEAEHMGLDENFGAKKNICIIEWAENIKGLLENYKIIEVKIIKIDEVTRSIELSSS
ncbi:MAG: tRNA (adenosine(37)-N6)-threonylcarbamoyltransferase complex ATPase subunit type 1 TsaE [Firmicutes bacterium]|nr:tRNA (adenosine(37)-N6)-threonylcarbamoyltransferase complex ATPase subunit type 1 TsaE [Bacillota bacterium]